MKKRISSILCALCLLLPPLSVGALAADGFTPAPQTAYAAAFIDAAEGQQWFLDEVERLLNQNQKSINTLTSPNDLSVVISLGLAGRNITGTVPRAVGELKELRYLYLSGNQFSGAIPESLFTLPKLERVDLADNQYAGAVPAGFGTMAPLRQLDLSGNGFTGAVPASLLANASLTFFDVAGNSLSGTLPTQLNQMTGLTYLNLSDNDWTGTLPELPSLLALKSLSIWGSGLSGEIPASYYTLTNLQVLDLAENQLTGSISGEIGNLTALQLLGLGGNKLSGVIPASIASLAKLDTLDLGDNRLESVIPNSFGSMAALREVHLENNRLRGLIPASLSARAAGGTTVYAANNYLTGEALKGLRTYEKNFCDGAVNEQFQLISIQPTVQLSESADTDLYQLLRNKSLTTGSTAVKPLLGADAYSVRVVSGDPTKVTITANASGILIRAAGEIPLANAPEIEIAILDNTGSAYSRVTIKVTTDTVTPPTPPTPPSPPSGDGPVGDKDDPKPGAKTHDPYLNGYPDGRFGPEDAVTREQVAKMVLGVMGVDVSPVRSTSYTDISSDKWSAPWVEQATAMGYLKGYGNGLFGPEHPMTRAELAACLVRIAEHQGKTADGEGLAFSDVEAGTWYASSVSRAAKLGLVTGFPDGTFRPNDSITRAEAVTMINRMAGRDPNTATGLDALNCPFSDVEEAGWAYLQIMEAGVKHQH